ncbi:hypothetical protein AOLI_G00168910 [Acnodon oligacanthus]
MRRKLTIQSCVQRLSVVIPAQQETALFEELKNCRSHQRECLQSFGLIDSCDNSLEEVSLGSRIRTVAVTRRLAFSPPLNPKEASVVAGLVLEPRCCLCTRFVLRAQERCSLNTCGSDSCRRLRASLCISPERVLCSNLHLCCDDIILSFHGFVLEDALSGSYNTG